MPVIVSCPNCDARYKLPDAVLARGARLKCAACEHRWVPEVQVAAPPIPSPRPPMTEADEEAAFVAVQEQISARWADAAMPVPPVTAAEVPPVVLEIGDGDGDDTLEDTNADAGNAPLRSTWLRNLGAGLAGLALAITAAGLWVGRVDLASTPYIGAALARLAPPVSLDISVVGTTTILPSGRLLLEVKGVIRNTGSATAAVPDLRASLSGPTGTALRWTISPHIRRLPAGTETEFSSTVIGFPPEARSVAITPAGTSLF